MANYSHIHNKDRPLCISL